MAPPGSSKSIFSTKPDGSHFSLSGSHREPAQVREPWSGPCCTGVTAITITLQATSRLEKAKAQVVVAIAWRVVVAIRSSRVPRIVVPAAATVHTV